MGFAPASLLAALSFADVLDETNGKGYQRRFSREHSLEFKPIYGGVGDELFCTLTISSFILSLGGAYAVRAEKTGHITHSAAREAP
jgi:hypothetical protein